MGKQLSAHFNEDEFRCKDGTLGTISPKLIKLLEWMRVYSGKPIKIISGYRSAAYNKKV